MSATFLRMAPRRACRRTCASARSRRAASRTRSKPRRRKSHALADAAEKYLAELTWRDFATALLDAHPDMATRALRPEFEGFPWRHDESGFDAWAHGHTGYPIVDAGMRQLWRTGYLPNRARLIVASFLVKHLLIDWRHGEDMVLGHADRRRSGQQSAQLAMGRGLGRRFRALLSHLQSGAAGGKVRPRRRLCAPMGPGACAARGARHPQSVAGAERGAC